MKKHLLYILVLVATFLLLTSCTGTSEVKANLGQEFALSVHQSAKIEVENLKISFEEVLEDSRCAIGAT